MTIANIITLLRLFLLPVIIYLFSLQTALASLSAVLLFFLIILSDVLDGYVARRRHEITKFGSFLDPVSDKIIIYVLLLVFSLKNNFWLIPLAIFFLRDSSVTFHRFIAAKNDLEIKDDPYRKARNIFQYTFLFFLLLENFLTYTYTDSFYMALTQFAILLFVVLAVVYSIFSTFYYFINVIRGIRKKIKVGREIKHERMVILANKKSRGYHDAYRRRLLNKFVKKRKAKISFLSVRKKNMFSGITNKIQNFEQVVIAGGDGSFESALNHQPFYKKSLGFFPLGAGNAFYSYFYKGNRFEYLRSRFLFQEMELDVLELEWEKGKRQTLFAAIGADSEVPRLAKERTQHGMFDYIGASWRGWVKGKADYEFKVKINGKDYNWENCMNISFGKIPYYGYGIRAFPKKIPPHDGKVYGVASVNPHSLFWNKPIRLWGLLLTTLGINKAPSLVFNGKTILIKSEVPFPIQAGGEYLGYSNWVKVTVKRKQKVLMI
ncbi:MAG: CDP-alcohol phosphatidyltransferase family protein [Nanoarchaeota archaeon]|nr:CDP-alcohol phosphatidyltransferase family protein [Nanoarchaeota archaeon]MBU1622790.1 CDP-alcohol phosphatidyltransferase family protein [Nanoarchaeota archaeon]